MYEQTLRPYRVRQTETEVTAVEWDMHRDPLSPEVLTQLFTHGATEEVNVGFDCVERIVLAADESSAINGGKTDLSKAQYDLRQANEYSRFLQNEVNRLNAKAQSESESADYKRMYELMQHRENMMYEIKRLKNNLAQLTQTYNEKVTLVVKLRQTLQSRDEKIKKIHAILSDKEAGND